MICRHVLIRSLFDVCCFDYPIDYEDTWSWLDCLGTAESMRVARALELGFHIYNSVGAVGLKEKMSGMKRFLEDVAEDMGLPINDDSGNINQQVLEEACRRLDEPEVDADA